MPTACTRAMRTFALLCLAACGINAAIPSSPPDFSWETLPLFMHSGNGSGPLSTTTADYMSRFPIVTMAGCGPR